ncbi:MAG: cysteine desulfurase family protein [Bacteroidota bacterium]
MDTNNIIYLDNNATTPIDKRVIAEMLPFFTDYFANPSSVHSFGRYIHKAVANAREQVASLIEATPSEIIFTSGATESINLALKGIALAHQHKGKHIITCQTEHKAVLDTCSYLEQIGFDVTYLPVEKDGVINMDTFRNTLKSDTILVAIMWVNNETGVIQPIRDIINLTHQNGSLFFTDATQAVGKIPIDVFNLDIDLLSFSSHKFYGARGIGGLFVKKGIKLLSQLHGGGHEFGLRSGTSNVPAIIGFGKACEIALKEMVIDAENIINLRNYLETELLKITGSFINGNLKERIFNTTNIYLPNFDANFFIDKQKNVAVSNGSACTSALIQPSHVLNSMGLSNEESLGSLRISLGKMNTLSEIKEFVKIINLFIKSE